MIYDSLSQVKSISPETVGVIPEWVFESNEPVVIKGLVSHWPVVQYEAINFEEFKTFLQNYWLTDKPVTAYVASPEVNGRFGYNHEFNNFNFRSGRASLPDIFERLIEQERLDKTDSHSIYVGSTPVDGWLPGFSEKNSISVPGQPLVNFWIGNRTTVSAHYDFPHNVACVARGSRRFTLFPTDQIKNLYIGPVDRTPSGQPISLVDFDNPDFERFPLFKEALKVAKTIVLEPGDAIFVPSMWWHHVKALSDCNMLVNYWWLDDSTGLRGSPVTALLHSIMGLRHLSREQKKAWKHIFDYYVFESDEHELGHIPEHAQGYLGNLNESELSRLRAEIINRLNH